MGALRRLAAACAATCVLATAVHGQERTQGAELWGRVILAGDTVGLAGTPVEIIERSVSTTAGTTGFYRFAGLAPGQLTVRVRRLGYESVSMSVVLREGTAEHRDVMLVRLPNTLTEVRIDGQVRKVPPRYQDVYRRMSTANGYFFTREDIDRLNPVDIQAMLQLVPTARVNNEGIQFARCDAGGAYAIARNRNASRNIQAQASATGSTGIHIYIDGFRMTGRSSPVGGNEQLDVLRMVNPSQVQAIEVYPGVSRIPGVFLEDACAVIAIWTKAF